MTRLGIFVLALALWQPATAQWQLAGQMSLDGRLFLQSPADPAQQYASLSYVLEPEFYLSWDAGAQSLTFRPFLRLDSADSERSHADIRELLWLRAGDDWEVRAGIGKVFWGVTEAWHLVDVVNQTDLVESPDGEQKLGQPMLKLSREGEFGILDFYLLPGFRERTFPGSRGRLRPQPRVAMELADFEAGNDERHVDLAMRWFQYIGNWDIGLSAFRGTSRDPDLAPALVGGELVLVPYYPLITQLSLDVQATKGDWLWKLEALRRNGQGGGYWAATGGFEYTLVGVAGGDADVGLLMELMLDSRGDEATGPFNQDVFLGLRWVANDVDGTELLAGLITDWDNGAKAFNLEASRRIGQRWKASLQAAAWFSVPAGDPFSAYQADDYVEARLIRYF
jgi:hypothetical protein